MQNLKEIYYSSNLNPIPNPDLLFLSGDIFYVQNYQTLAITIFAIERGGKSTGGKEGENRSLR